MQCTLKLLLALAVLVMSLDVGAAASKPGSTPQSGAVEFVAPDEYVANQSAGPTLSQAVEQVRRQYNGRIVSAETQMQGKQEMHVIKVLTDDGKVKTVRVRGRRRE